MLAAVTLGAFGALDVVGTAFPKTMVRLYKLSALEQPTSEQKKEARDLQWKVATMGEFYNTWCVLGPFIPVIHLCRYRIGANNLSDCSK